jgi:hypothetical protein
LDLPAPTTGWLIELDRRGVEVVVDDIGRPAVSRDDARRLFTEHREAEARAREMAAQNEQAAIAADQQWRAQLSPGVPWWQIPGGVSPAQAMFAADRDDNPRRRTLTEDLLDRSDTMVFHPMQGDES